MSETSSAVSGILGMGLYLPETRRTNDWWPAETVERWRAEPKRDNPVAMLEQGPIWEALKKLREDPFGGAVERRVIDEGMSASQMETEVARRALDSAGVGPADIDLLLINSWMPTLIGTNDACTVHEALGLRPECMTLTMEAPFNSFQQQVVLADAMIRAGHARHALLIQSSVISRFLDYEMPFSPWFGDGATAQVVGPASAECQILGSAQRTDGKVQGALMIGTPDKRWHDGGDLVLYVVRAELPLRILNQLSDCAAEATEVALQRAGVRKEQIEFYASHQPAPWFRPLTQSATGLDHAAHADTFEEVGSLGAPNIPLSLHAGIERGLLEPGQLVVTHSGGAGGTWGSLVLRWGSSAMPPGPFSQS